MKKREFIMLAAAVCVVGLLFAGQYLGAAMETGAWGLSFQAEGQTPIAPAGGDELKQYDAA